MKRILDPCIQSHHPDHPGRDKTFMMSSSNSKGAKRGNNWEYQVYFDPESDKCRGRCYNISDDSLISAMSELIDYRENITDIWVYRCPLSAWQLTQVFFNHQFVVLETNDWWWSIEKNSKEIVIQRSKDKSWVRDYSILNKKQGIHQWRY